MFPRQPRIHFINSTDVPVMVEGWVENSLERVRVAPREKKIVFSSTGEWYLNAMLNREDRKLWDENEKIKHVILIGKFRYNQCMSGNYSWLEQDGLFDCIYSELEQPEDGVKGVMTFHLS
jgi:hypothetical protein